MHIGKLVKEIIEQKKIIKAQIAEELSMSAQNLHDLFKRSTVDIDLLYRLGQAVEYDFIGRIYKENQKKFGPLVETEKAQPEAAKIAVTVELDGTEAGLEWWISRLTKINALVG